MFGEHAEEAFDRTELRRVDHHRLLAGAVGGDVFEAEALRLVEVELDGRHLPGAADRVPGLDGDLRAVERRAAGIGDEFETRLRGDLLEGRGGFGPLLVGADELVLLLPVLVAGGEFEVEVVESEVAQEAEDEAEEVSDLCGGVFDGDVRVRVVLGQRPHAGEPVDDAGGLIAVDGAELEQPQRQVAVGAAAGAVDEVVHRAVHRLEAVRGAVLDDLALLVATSSTSMGGNMFSP